MNRRLRRRYSCLRTSHCSADSPNLRAERAASPGVFPPRTHASKSGSRPSRTEGNGLSSVLKSWSLLFNSMTKAIAISQWAAVENAGDYHNGALAVQSTNGLEIQDGEFPQNESS